MKSKNWIVLHKTNRYKSIEDIKTLIIDLSLNYYGWEQCSPCHSYGPGIRNSSYIHIITEGKGTLYIEDYKFELGKGDSFLILAGVKARYIADIDNPWTYSWVGFSGVMVLDIATRAGYTKQYPIIKIKNLSIFEKLIKQMIESDQQTFANDLKRRGLFYEFLSHIIEEGNKENNVINNLEGTKKYYAKELYYYIKMQYAKPIKVQEIANIYGISRNYLFSIFKEEYQMSPKQFLMKVRMENSLGLLINKSLTISEISNMVGYDDTITFSKAFKKIYLKSPTEYRKSM